MPRTIDADKLKEAFELDGFLSPYMQRMIDACPTVGEWISVKDRLPDIDAEVLIRTEEGLYDVACFSGADRFWTFERNPSCWVSAIGVTHWMPLPEPPKEDAE